MELADSYEELHSHIKKQLSILHNTFERNEEVKLYFQHMKEKIQSKDKTKDKFLFRLCILTVIDPMKVIVPVNFDKIYCHHERDEEKVLHFLRVLKEGKHARVLECVSEVERKKYIMKCYKSEKRDTCFEIGIYNLLKKTY